MVKYALLLVFLIIGAIVPTPAHAVRAFVGINYNSCTGIGAAGGDEYFLCDLTLQKNCHYEAIWVGESVIIVWICD